MTITESATQADKSAPSRAPPGWGRDDLSAFLEAARANQFASFANKSERYRRLAAIDEIFVRAAKNWTNPKDMLAALLFLRCHSAFRAACGLAMAGQTVEATAMHRACLETAAYALHINRNAGLGRVWLDRHQDKASLKRVRKEFAIEKVRATIVRCNRHAAERFDRLYQRAIDFGGHPNERSVTGNMEIERLPDRALLKAVYLQGDGVPLEAALKTTAECGMVALEILQCVFNALFELLGINAAMLELRKQV